MALGIGLLMFVGLLGFIVLGTRLGDVFRKIRNLEEEIRGLRAALARLEADLPRLTFGKGVLGETGPVQERRPPPVVPVPPPPQTTPAPAASQPPPPVQTLFQESARTAPKTPSRSSEEWEALIGGKLLNRIGAVALILGVGFFLKYAFDNNWISEAVRVLIGALAGGLCLVAAARTRRKGFQIFSQGLVGAGIAILYLSVFAAFNFYTLVSQPVAYVLMSVVTLIAYVHAFRYESHVVAVLGLFGGFLTPYLLTTEAMSLSGLFSYVLLLDAGILLIALRKQGWISLEPLAVIGTYLVFYTWFDSSRPEPGIEAMTAFVAGFGFLFHGADLLKISGGAIDAFDLRRVTAMVQSVLLYSALLTVLDQVSDEARAGATAVLAAVYAASAWLGRKHPSRAKFLFGEFIVTSIVLLLIAVAIQFDDLTLMTIWAVLCGGLAWIGIRSARASVWVPAVAFFPFVFLGLLITPGAVSYSPLESFVPVWNLRALAFAALTVSIGATAYVYRKYAVKPGRELGEILEYGWMGVLFFALSVETLDLVRYWMAGQPESTRLHLGFQRTLALSVVWTLVALPLAVRGLRARNRPLFFGPLWILFAAALTACIRSLWYVPIEEFRLLTNPRVATLLFMTGCTVVLVRLLSKHRTAFHWVEDFMSPSRILAVMLLLILVSTETWDYFSQELSLAAGSGAPRITGRRIEELLNLQQLSLSVVWLVFSLLLMGLGLWKRNRAFRIQSIFIFGVAILKIFIYDLSFLETLYRIFSFVGLGLILLIVSYLYQRFREVILGPPSDAGGSG